MIDPGGERVEDLDVEVEEVLEHVGVKKVSAK